MKKMKKILGLRGKRRGREPLQPWQTPSGGGGGGAKAASLPGSGGYQVRSKDLGKLHRAAAEGNLGELRHLLQKHDLDEQDREGRTPLHFACANGCTDIVTFLVDNKCQINIYDSDKRSPLMKAVQCQQEFCAIYLLEHGADPNLGDAYNNTALHFAASSSSISIAQHLLEHRAHIEAHNKDGSTPLIVAVAENNREMVEFLLKKGASVHATDKSGRTPLLIAAANKKRDLTNVLLFHGSDVSHKDESGWSARDYALLSDDPILLQYIADYSRQRDREEDSLDDQNVLSILSSPGKVRDTGITLGAPATNREDREGQQSFNQAAGDSGRVVDDHSSGDSVRVSEQMDDDTWQSSEEEELDFSPKKPPKPSLAHLMNVSQQLKKSYVKSSIMRTERIASSQHNKSDCEAEDDNVSLPKPLFQVKSFPQPIHSSPGSFSKCSQMTSHLNSKQVESEKEEEEEEEDSEEEDGKNSDVMDKKLPCNESSQNWNASQDAVIRKATAAVGMDGVEKEEKGAESPWDSECITESPKKSSASSLPASPAKIMTCMHSITEEPYERKSEDIKPETASTILQHDATSSHVLKHIESKEKQKSDLMEELGFDDADDIEDASDWDSTSLSIKSVPCAKLYDVLMVGEHTSPLQLGKSACINENSVLSRAQQLCDGLTTVASKGQQGVEQNNTGELERDENKDKSEIDTRNSLENLSLETQTDQSEVPYVCDEKKIGAVIHSEEPNNESSHFDSTIWEERYEKMWVANEKREVKSHFKSITAELKQMFGEISKNEKKSNTPVEGQLQDGLSGFSEGIKESPPPHLSKATIGTPGEGDIRQLKPVSSEEKINTENSVLYPQKNERPNVKMDLKTNNEVLPNNAEEAGVNVNEVKGDNKCIQLEKIMSGNIIASEKYPDYSPLPSSRDTSNTFCKRTFFSHPTADHGGANVESEETLHYFNNCVRSCKYSDTESGNQVKYSVETCCIPSKKQLDEELECDVARFKNEVGMLQIAFLALEREKAQLQKEVEDEKRKQGLEAEGKKETVVNPGKTVDEETEQKTKQMPTVDENQYIKTEDDKTEENQVINRISSPERKRFMPISYQDKNLFASGRDVRKSGNKKTVLKQRVTEEITDDSSLSEASLEEERRAAKPVNEKKKIQRRMGITVDFDDLTQSSDTATEDLELPATITKEAMILIEQLSSDSKDSVNILKLRNIFHGYERLIEHEKGCYTHLSGKVKKLQNEKKEQQSILEEMRELKSILDQQQLERESDISSLKFSLKQEEEKRMSAEMLYEKSQEQLRKKEEQYCKQVEEKQQIELMLRSSEMELRTLRNHLKQVEEERNEIQQQLSQEQNVRVLQEGILNTHLWRKKDLEKESDKVTAKHSEMSDNYDQEKELLHKNQILQDELAVLRLELDRIRVHHQDEESKYLEENEALKEKTEELKKELKLNEDALTQTVFQYNGQINVSKTEAAMITSKLEHMKEHKERLEVELDSFRSRLSSAVQELERCQTSKNDVERVLQRERDEWIRLKDKLNHDICTLRETNTTMSQQLTKAESKANGLENELHHVTHSLREKTLLLESCQRDLSQAQCQVKELENARQAEKDQMNKYIVKQDSMQERLAQLQSENLLLRQQFEDFQNKSIIKEKVVTDVQDKFSDIFSKLRVDTEKQVQLVEERNKELVTKCNNLREQILKYEAEKADRESTIRQLQQELADSLKKQSMTEASLEVSTRYRIDLEEDKQQLQKEIERMKAKLQESEEQYFQSERCVHNFKNALDAKEHEASVASQKLKDLLVASSGANNAIKQLEEHVQRLEIENARLEATTNQQTNRIEILQKDLHNNSSVHNHLEELITGLQTAKINLEEQISQQVQKQTMLSATAQGTHNMWEEEMKSRSKLGVRLSELDRQKTELMAQLENEKKKIKKLVELKQSVETRLDQEMKRNSELQKECNGIKKLLKTTKKKLKEYENGESSSQSNFNGEIKKRYSEIDIEVGKLTKKVDELSHNLAIESTRCTQLESTNHELYEQLSSMKMLHKNHEKLERSKQQLEEEIVNLKQHIQGNVIDLNQMEQYKRDIEERARQEVRQKLEEVNLFLQTQAASQEALEQIRATNNASLRSQLENRIRDLESELTKLKSSQQDNMLQKESTHTELERYKELYSEELKMRKSLRSKLDRANEKLSEANAELYYERQRSRSLLANGFLGGNLSTSPVLETVQFGNLGCNLALTRPLSLGGEFVNPTRSPLTSKNRVETYLAKMQMELEKNITKELDQAKAELDAGSARVSPIGAVDGSSKSPNAQQDQVSKATQQYLDVLKKNYLI
ncbi:ankyrin repeat domain-containing protein 26-like isoform X5 [Sceloporus undulatus]|uniref:ankyrin repeat domain-containing protein 26-like isoform X5 n=1 Tax=Sceloporus undulatus TaxID=8520 RepID=UPI001C4C86FC|nr:ankyrin repeat domain-containing protein 26-like isoform X5 [Sceloporus undulatus]